MSKCQNSARKVEQGVQHHAWSLVVLLQGLIAIGPTRISIGKISNNCEFEFVVGL
jgi:hypothetical protein